MFRSIRCDVKRRSWLVGAVSATLLAFAGAGVQAQDYPNRPVKIVSYVPSGSAADAVMRAVAGEVSRNTGAEFIVENRPGGSGAVSATAVKTAPADGYTLLVSGSSFMLSTILRGDDTVPFADLAPITAVVTTPMIFAVRSDLGVENLRDFISLAKEKPATLTFASTGIGSIAHVYGEQMSRRADVQLLHVPYQTVSASVTDTIGGRIDSIFSLVGTVQPHISTGKLSGMAITGEKRASSTPDLPTFVELGYTDMDMAAWNGVFAPAQTPPEILERLAVEFAKAAGHPKVVELATTMGLEATSTTRADFQARVAKEWAYWNRTINETGISLK